MHQTKEIFIRIPNKYYKIKEASEHFKITRY
jgi:hypothetical protein